MATKPRGVATRGPTAPILENDPVVSSNDKQHTIQFAVRSSPKPTATWTKDGKPISAANRRVKSKLDGLVPNFTVSLTITDFDEAHDPGEYKCTVKNSLGSVVVSAVMDKVTTSTEPSDKGKIAEIRLLDAKIQINEARRCAEICIACHTDSKNKPEVKWFRENKLLQAPNYNPDAMFEEGSWNFYLEILKVGPEIKGNYKLEVDFSDAGKAHKTFSISQDRVKTLTEELSKLSKKGEQKSPPAIEPPVIEEPLPLIKGVNDKPQSPEFVRYPENMTLTAGKTDSVEAVISGNPFPTVKWYKGRNELPVGVKYHVSADQKTGKIRLEIVRPKSADEGQYTVKISNSRGETSSQFNIYVQDPSSATLDFRGTLRRLSSSADRASVASVMSQGTTDGRESREDSAEPGGPKDYRRQSLANVIPDWPSLRKTKVAQKEKDRWIEGLKNCQCNESDGVATLSAVFCKPGGILRWYKNRVEIFHGPKYNFVSEGNVQKLIINKLHPDDSGRYICSINDIETTCWLEVSPAQVVYDFYKQLPAKMEIFRTKPTILECHVNDTGCPVVWMKNKKEIDGTDKRITTYGDGTRRILRIQRTQKADEAVYACQIKGEPQKITTCYLYVTEPQWRFSRKLPPEIRGNEHDEIMLEVEVEDLDAEVEWFHHGELITEETDPSKYRFEQDGRIRRMFIINSDPKKDSGKYECRTGVMSSQTNVQVIPALQFVRPLRDCTVQEGKDIRLEIVLNAKRPMITWTKDNQQTILPTNRVFVGDEGVNHWLVIQKATLADHGVYKASVDGVETSCTVTVKEAPTPPSFELGKVPKSITVRVGEPVTITIPFKGSPTPTATWTLNGKPIDSKLVTIDETNKICTLSIKQSKRTDSGTYSLKLSNNVGQVEAKIPVAVIDKPGEPGPITIVGTTRTSCTLSWDAPKDDGGSPVTGYIIERLDNKTKQWIKVEQVARDQLRCTVKGLIENDKCHFRVCAVNQMGAGEYVQTTKPVLIKDEAVPPPAPGKPMVTETTHESVTLKCTIPTKDGGAPITTYIVEMREGKTGSWTKSIEVPASAVDKGSLTATIPHLKEKSEYEFRVKAVNRTGQGEASDTTGTVVTPAKKFAPIIEKKTHKALVLKVGEKLVLDYSYRAEPKPKITWYFDNKVLTEEELATKVKNFDGRTQLTIDQAERPHAGLYSLTLENEVGKDVAQREVIVRGPPSPPTGPLVVSDVQKNKVTLTWKPPADDGGCLVTNYTVERLDEETGKWIGVTDSVSGTQFTVRKLQQGHSYQFRVRAENSLGLSEPLCTTTPTIAKDPFNPPDAPTKPVLVSRDRTQIEIKWDKPENDGGAPIRGYYVERFNAASNRWKRVNADLLESTTFKDNTVTANQEYRYRVIAVNSAGEGGPSEETEFIMARPEKEMPTIDVSSIPKVYGRNEIRVRAGERATIELPVSGIPTPTCDWFKEDMEIRTNESLQVDHADDRTKLTIPCAKREDTGDYKVIVRNDVGKAEETVKLIVLDKPSPCVGPINVQNIDKTTVELSWAPPNDDGGSPVVGYKIEKCPEGGVWETCDESCSYPRIRIKDLDSFAKYKFRVQAHNKYGHSIPIETSLITVKPPYDAPDAPKDVQVAGVDENCISLTWEKPDNDGGNPIEGYDIEMREKGGEWRKVNKRIVRTPNYSCHDVVPGKEYDFRVRAVNEAGPGEASRPTGFTKAQRPMSAPLAPPTPKVLSTTNSSVTLGISPPSDDGGSKILGYVVEKLLDGQTEWSVAERVPAETTSVTVKDLTEGKDYSFRVKAVNEVGEGEPSERTKLVTVENEPEAPSFLDVDDEHRRIVVRAGKPINVEIPYRGNPKPFAALDRLDDVIVDSSKLKPEVLDDKVLIKCGSAQRPMTGKYNVTLKNRLGKALLPIEIVVQDKPAKPKGPLKATVVDGKKVMLEWKAPTDDGGSEVTSYKVEKRLAGTDRWVPVAPAVHGTRCEITDVNVGDRYDFRVAAVNEFGEGDALETDHSVKVQLPFKTPGPVGKIECKSRSPESIELEWQRPENDGGSPITGYVVEIKAANEKKWTPVTTRRITKTEVTAPGLTEGQKYNFRVAAVNEAGVGEWREVIDLIEARLPDEAPTLYGFESGPREIRVKQGEPFSIRMPFTASPAPTATVTKGGEPVTDDNFLTTSVQDGQVILNCKKATPKHEGNYTCTITNPSGSAAGQVKLVVLGPPGQPRGPLKATECTPDGCILTWQPPETTGGEDISNYVVEMMDTKDGEWIPLSKSCRDTSYEVYGLKPGHLYKYRVSAQNINGTSEPLETSEAIVADYPFKVPSSPNCLEAVDVTDTKATLRWNRPSHDGGSAIRGYRVEMRGPKSDEWVPVTTEPIDDTSIVIDSLKPNQTYEFRVAAKNEAGFSEPETLDRPVKTKRKAARPSAPSAPQVSRVTDNSVDIEWSSPTDDGGIPLKGYIVEKREANNPYWEQALPEPVADQKCTVPGLRKNSVYEFRVRATNDVGQSEPSQSSAMTKVAAHIDGEAPSIVRPLSKVIVAPNHSAELTVEFTSKPAPLVKWYKNEVQIMPGGRFFTRQDGNKATLSIQPALNTDHASEIKCVIENPLGVATSECVIDVTKPPRIDTYPVNQTVTAGEDVRVKIPITTSTPVKCAIWKDGEKFYEPDDRVKVTALDDVVTIVLPESDASTEGSYTVALENDAGTATANFDVKVLRTPATPTGPLTTSDVTSSSCALSWRPPTDDGNCKVTHYVVEKLDLSEPGSEWTTVPALFKDTRAELNRLPRDHQFLFRVKAVNQQGEGEPLTAGQPTQLKSAYGLPPVAGKPQLTTIEDGRINLQWPRSRQTDTPVDGYFLEVRPTDGSAEWYRINTNTPFTTNKASVSNLEEGQNYEFRVIATNDCGESAPSEISEPILFTDDSIVVAPTIKQELRSQSAKEGNNVTFTIEADGRPKPTVKWFKNELEIDCDKKYEITSDGNTHQLTIFDVTSEDIGDYSVKVKNKGGTKSSRASLNVLSRPKIKLPATYERPLSFKEGQDVEIKVPLVSQEVPDVQWTCSGRPIRNDDRHQIETTEKYVTLRLKKGVKDDTGQYELTVSNSIGTDNATINLNVIGAPEPPRHLKVENVEDEVVTIAWSLPLHDGGDEITNYIVESRVNEPGATWTRAAYSRTPRCKLANLNANTQYQFRVIAENINGSSAPCEPTGIVTTGDSALARERKKRTPYGVDSEGRPIRGLEGYAPVDYDKCYYDCWQRGKPAPAYTSSSSIYDSYDIFEEIGGSQFGTSHRAVERRSGKPFVATFRQTFTDAEKNTVKEEIETMTKLVHPNLLNIHEIFQDKDEYSIISEFLSGGNVLDKFGSNANRPMTEDDAANYVRQICEALKYMHDNNYVHLNLKPESAVFTTKTSDQLKLVDFNLAKKLAPNEDAHVCLEAIEFAAPEVVTGDDVGFYTDMWAVGVLAYLMLSGKSPFGADEETRRKIVECNVDFPGALGFDNVSDEAKDFIKHLLLRNKNGRMTVHEALDHPWLASANRERRQNILRRDTYAEEEEMLKRRRASHQPQVLEIGRVSSYSNLRNYQPFEYNIHKTRFDRHEAYPRFIMGLRNVYVLEGDNAEFNCRIVSGTPFDVNWFNQYGQEIKQSVKHSKRAEGNTYALEIRKCSVDDKGNYCVRASNSYGERSMERTLFVQTVPQPIPPPPIKRATPIRHVEYTMGEIWEEKDTGPAFTYQLRPRVVSEGQSVKLTCTVSGKPSPKISWFKDKTRLGPSGPNYSITNQHGVCTLELSNAQVEDSGWYRCLAENKAGYAETSCQVLVIGSRMRVVPPIETREHDGGGYTIRQEIVRTSRPSMTGFSETTFETFETEYKSHTASRRRSSTRPPNLEELLSDTTVYDGSILQLRCSVSDRLPPTVTWYKDDEPLGDSDHIKMEFDGHVATLTIPEVRTSDAGIYRCELKNEVGTVDVDAQVIVKDRRLTEPIVETAEPAETVEIANGEVDSHAEPEETSETSQPVEEPVANGDHTEAEGARGELKFAQFLKSQSLKEEDTLLLSCDVDGGSGQYDVEWFRNGKTVPDGKDFEKGRDNNSFHMKIADVIPEDAGSFAIKISDRQTGQSVRSDCTILIKGEEEKVQDPKIEVFPQSRTIPAGKSATFVCRAKSKSQLSGNWYFNDVVIKEDKNHKIRADKINKQFELEIVNASNKDQGVYRLDIAKPLKKGTISVLSNLYVTNE